MIDDDLAAIEAAVQSYFDGMHECDAGKLERAFHPTARIQGYVGESMKSITREEFTGFVGSLESRRSAGEAFDMQIASIDRTGRAAVAKVTMRWNGHSYTDYLALIKRDEGWSISEKTFFSPS